ncbi:MAG: oxidoreductase [Rhodobacteraceae bacterium]|nr:oxidoreductase [Paracoccaceae bacterium]
MTETTELKALEGAVKRDLELLAYPAKEWVTPRGNDILDCAIVGGGQLGLSVAFALMRERVTNIRVFDASPEGREGPWITFARMQTLRTPKLYSGPEVGFANLTFRAWFEAVKGADAWDGIDRIARQDWMAYLVWFRQVLDLPVTNDARVARVIPEADETFRLIVETPGETQELRARTLVYATGAFGAGQDFVPSAIAALPDGCWRHSNQSFDHALFRGKRVGVLGAGASAFDCAATAMETGAVSAEICFRRAKLPVQNPRRFLETAGFLGQFRDLPDAKKWRCVKHLHDIGQPPPAATFQRALSQGVKLRPFAPWTAARIDEAGAIEIDTGRERLTYDFVVVATGMVLDLGQRPELADIVGDIALWGDRYVPPEGEDCAYLSSHPYQGDRGQLLEKVPGQAPWLRRVFMLNGASGPSLGPTIHSCAAMRYAAPMIARGVVGELFKDEADAILDDLVGQIHYEAGLDELLAEQPATAARG